jgi:hypothetical protein
MEKPFTRKKLSVTPDPGQTFIKDVNLGASVPIEVFIKKYLDDIQYIVYQGWTGTRHQIYFWNPLMGIYYIGKKKINLQEWGLNPEYSKIVKIYLSPTYLLK